MKTAALGVILLLGVGLTACTFPSKGRVVSRQQAGQMRRIEYGTVEKVSNVVVEGRQGPIGLWGGAAMGVAATGGDVGHGHGVGNDVAQVSAGIAGAVAGQAVEEAATRADALEMFIKLDSGALVVITQTGPPGFNVGERVAVASGAGGAQVLVP